jgi:hypothetical protein
MLKKDQALLQTKPVNIYSLYNDYAGMLLGYVLETVKDKKQAEEYVVKIFGNLAADPEVNKINTWCRLQLFAKQELANYHGSEALYNPSNKYLNQMTDEQRHIFCSFYYTKKTTTQLAKELNRSEDLIKKLLKEAFVLIRRSHDN